MDVRTFFPSSASRAAGLVLAAAAPAVLAADGRQQSVSSDAGAPPALAGAAAPGAGSLPFAGRAAPGEAPDAQAEFPASVLSAAEYAAFTARFKPLRPPGAAPAGAPAESVIGPDRRLRLDPRASGFPYRAIGLLTFTQGGGAYTCSGWLISADTVATAGQCVTAGAGGPWSTDVRFYPARNGPASPYGACSARRLYSVTGWTRDGLEEYDYGAVKLNCRVGNTTGWLGYYARHRSEPGLPVWVLGYPGDKPAGTLWAGAGGVATAEHRKTRYFIDTSSGMGGGPVLENDRGASRAGCFGACGVGIHTYGSGSEGPNSGTHINAGVAYNLGVWKDAP